MIFFFNKRILFGYAGGMNLDFEVVWGYIESGCFLNYFLFKNILKIYFYYFLKYF